MKVSGVIHMHSTHSYDGKMSLAELKNCLQERGVQFACMTEHTDQLSKEAADKFVSECRELSDENFIFVPGFEVPYKRAHILHIGATEFVCSFADKEQLNKWRAITPLVVLAHPVRNKFKVDENMLESIDGVEVWNQQYEGKSVPRVRSVSLLAKLRKQKDLLAFGGLDLHRSEHFGSPVTEIETEGLNEESIVAALKNGQFSFGHEDLSIKAKDEWRPNLMEKLRSFKSTLIIKAGKLVNKVLFNLGLSLPKSLKQKVRARV